MKVQFEKAPTAFNTCAKNYELWDLVERAIIATSIDQFYKVDLPKFKNSEWFAIGSGAGHIWVHEKDWRGSGKTEDKRLILITE